MSLHGSGQTEGERTLPLPRTAPATLPGSWTPGPGGWQPRGAWPPPPPQPRRGRAALVVVGVVAAITLLAVAFSFAVVGTSPRRRVATSANNPPAASPLVSPSDTSAPAVRIPPPEASEAPASPQAPAAARVLTPSQIAATVDPSVVDVNTVLGPGQGSAAGTGIVLSSTGEILTNNHVIDGYSSIMVAVPGTRRSYPAVLVGRVLDQDVALLQVQRAPDLTPAPFGNSAKLSVGDAVVALGNALGRAGTPQVSQGLVVALNRNIVATDQSGAVQESLGGLIETSAALQPGDSGGPLVDAAGEVIGMDTAASTRLHFNAAGIGFAIPINQALDIVRQIRSGAGTTPSPAPPPQTQRGFLGVEVQADAGQGALVAGVVAGSPADTAGIAAGDVIVAVDGAAVDSPPTLTAILSAHRPGDQVRVTWMDALGIRFTAAITLAAQG